MMRAILAFALLPFALPAQTMEERVQDLAVLYAATDPADCLSRAAGPGAAEGCVGAASDSCMALEADGYTTFGMMTCAMAETAAWDDLLNAEYQKTRARAAAMDGYESQPEYAVRADRLLDAQRAWITFRDAECALAYSEFGAGTMRVLASSGCHLQMTADRTIQLKFMFGEI